MSDYPSPSIGNADIANKIVEANSLETSGEIERAIAMYREIFELDRDGTYGAVAQQALKNLQTVPETQGEPTTIIQPDAHTWWSKLSLKTKTTVVLVGISVLSTVGIASLTYSFANRAITDRILAAKQETAREVANKVAFYMRERFGDIQVMSNLSILTDPELRSNTSDFDKQTALDSFIQAYTIYDSVAAFDLEGNVIAQSTGKPLNNSKNHSYFQAALAANGPVISQPLYLEDTEVMAVYLAAPIKDSISGENIGVIGARMPVRYLQDVIQSVEAENNYLIDDRGQIFAASDNEEFEQIQSMEAKAQPVDERFAFLSPSNALYDNPNSTPTEDSRISSRQSRQKQTIVTDGELVFYIPFSNFEDEFRSQLPNLGWSIITSIDKDTAFSAQRKLLLAFVAGTLIVAAVVTAIAALVSDRAIRPILEAAAAVKKLGKGELHTRLAVRGTDELADLGTNINVMAGQLENLLKLREAEAREQRLEKENLQKGVINLLLDVEGAQQGDLTVQARMSDDAVGSIADAFNTTIRKLRGLLEQVQTVSDEVGQLSLTGESSVRQLSEAASNQASEIDLALNNIAEINDSVQKVANYAREAAQIARLGLLQAREGDTDMEQTVNSIEKIRMTVASTSKKVKQLAESSQEIAQIVDIISGISEKTNLLAFNASVEAARAGEHGEGFKIVAEEVRRLADRITEATKDIKQLVSSIQVDTTAVLQGIEAGTTEVVTGSELVHKTQETLKGLAQTSDEIDKYLQSISTNTTEQTNISQQVKEKITGIASIARNNSTEAEDVVKSLRTLVQEAEMLRSSVSQFKLHA